MSFNDENQRENPQRPRIKHRRFLVELIELALNAPTDTDQYKTAEATIQHRLKCQAITVQDVINASKVSVTGGAVPTGVLAGLLSVLTGEVITAVDIMKHRPEA